jgi:ribosome recycling factor
MIQEILSDLKGELDATVVSLRRDLARIRAGRANPSVLDGVMVDYYGTETPLNKLATVSVPEPRMLVVQPFDQSSIANVDKAIRSANLGLSPMNDGRVVRVPMPELTEERRRDLVKQARHEAENHRISARNHRRDANEMLKQLAADKEISEDDLRTSLDRVQKATDECIKKVDEVLSEKEADIMAV